MLIAAFVGGYVAARSAGLRRSTDGILHGVVWWGVTVLFFALVTGPVAGDGSAAPLTAAPPALCSPPRTARISRAPETGGCRAGICRVLHRPRAGAPGRRRARRQGG